MKRSERALIYTALVAMLAMNSVFLLSNSGRIAFAEAAAWLQDLGPADSLKLVDGSKEMSVRAKEGRVAYGDGDFRQTYSVGFVDIGKALNPLMEASQFVEEREALRAELEGQEQQYKTQLEAFEQELRGMDQNAPEFQERYAAAVKVYEDYQKWGREVAIKMRDDLDVKHLQAAYKELSNAVNVVADKMGIDIVYRFIPADKEFTAQNADQALTEVRLRTAVKYPEKLDITTEVLEELSLQDTDG